MPTMKPPRKKRRTTWLQDFQSDATSVRNVRMPNVQPQRTIGPARTDSRQYLPSEADVKVLKEQSVLGSPFQRKAAELLGYLPGGASGMEAAKGNLAMAGVLGTLDILPGGKLTNKFVRRALAEEIAQKAAQGFSYQPSTGRYLTRETGGFAVGAGSKEKRLLTGQALSPDQIEDFLAKNADYFDKNPNAILGGWTDESGKTFIEPSELFPTKEAALAAGKERGEQAVWDFGTMSEVAVPRGGFEVQGKSFDTLEQATKYAAKKAQRGNLVNVMEKRSEGGWKRALRVGPNGARLVDDAPAGQSEIKFMMPDGSEFTTRGGQAPNELHADMLGDIPAAKGKESVKEAAIRMPDGRVFTGRDHFSAIEQATAAGVPNEALGEAADGFTTSSGRFVDREEAYTIHTGKKPRPYEWPPGLMAEEINHPGAVSRAEPPKRTKAEKEEIYKAAGATTRQERKLATMAANRSPAVVSGDPSKAWGSLFDYGSLGKDVLPVEQAALNRPVPESVTGLTNYSRAAERASEALRSPENMKRLDAGLAAGGERWYYLDPLARTFMDLLGEEEGKRRFQLLTKTVAATSPNSEIGRNIRAAGALFPHVLEGYPLGRVPNLNAVLAKGLGNTAHNVQRDMLGRVVEGAPSIAAEPWKADAFAANLWGNFEPATVDRHFFRQAGEKKSQYLGVEDAAADLAAELAASGKLPVAEGRAATAPYQAALWIGDALQGRVLSPPKPALSIFEDELRKSAAAESITPNAALKKFIQGQLWGFAGGAPGLIRF